MLANWRKLGFSLRYVDKKTINEFLKLYILKKKISSCQSKRKIERTFAYQLADNLPAKPLKVQVIKQFIIQNKFFSSNPAKPEGH